VGTSALREAENAGDFIRMAQEATGIGIDIITGQEEARLTALGVFSSLQRPKSFLIVDIGGGSTEFIYSKADGEPGHISETVGAVNLLEAHISSDPPTEAELTAVKVACDRASVSVASRLSDYSRDGSVLIGTAGTASTLAAIDLGLGDYDAEKIHNHEITIDKLYEILAMLKTMPLAERAIVKGLEPKRADLIIPGIILTISLMETFGFTAIKISDKGLLEGIVLDMAGEVSK
jgi:exopolyphosphatase/guanosine-5'-triphosphate,3'-diphosphate pyrophosphatase